MIQLSNDDCFNVLPTIENSSIDLILSDIPYGICIDEWDVIHNNKNKALLGSSPAQKNSNKAFTTRGKPLNGWSSSDKKIPYEYYSWCLKWSAEFNRITKPGSSVFIFAGRRFAHRCISALEDSGFIFKDMLAWNKSVALYKAQRVSVIFENRGDYENAKKWKGWRVGNLKPLFEPILWFMKPYKIGKTITDNILKYNLGAFNEEALLRYTKNTSNIFDIKPNRDDCGLHPTQKPLELFKFLIELTTSENQVVLDPFMGSGTTGVACRQLNRGFIGIEKSTEYFNIAKRRIDSAPVVSEQCERGLEKYSNLW